MKSFENLEVAEVGVPTRKDVLERLRRDARCRADPVSYFCTFASGKDDYLLRDVSAAKVCERCPVFADTRQKLMADWEEWILAMQDAFT